MSDDQPHVTNEIFEVALSHGSTARVPVTQVEGGGATKTGWLSLMSWLRPTSSTSHTTPPSTFAVSWLAAALLLTACGGTETASSTGLAVPASAPAMTEPSHSTPFMTTQPPSAPSPAAPLAVPAPPVAPAPLAPASGDVTRELVGMWEGGPGAQSGWRLIITADGRYELAHERSSPAWPIFVEQGVAFSQGSDLELTPTVVEGDVQREPRVAQWSIQPSSVVAVLTVIDPIDGEFSYVRTA